VSSDPSRGEWLWLWREVRPFLSYQVVSLLLILASTAVGLTGPLLMKWLIDDILPNKRWAALGVVTLLFFLTFMGRMLLGMVGGLVNALAVQRLTYRVRTRLLKHLQSLSAAFYGQQPVGDLMQRLERDVSLVTEMGSDVVPSIVRMIFETILTVSAMVFLDWHVSLVVVPLLPIFAWVRQYFRATLRRSSEEVRDATGKQSSLLNEMLTGAIQVQLLGAEQRLGRRYAHLSLVAMDKQMKQRKLEITYSLASLSTIALGTALIVGYSGVRVINGTLTAGTLVAFYAYVGQIFSPMSTAVELYARMNRVRASIRRLIDLEETPSAIRDQPDATPLADLPQWLACADVSFDYKLANGTNGLSSKDGPESKDRAAPTDDLGSKAGPARTDDTSPKEYETPNAWQTLHRVAFEARAGERVAVVGESGCGKSSLLKLIPRLYDASDGLLTIDGRDLRAVQLRSLRKAISFVPQEPILFQGTIRDNLRHGSPGATTEDIEHAAWIACLTDVVERLPKQWDNELGPMGGGLSGGERQRLAITRALLQRRPILILDEATSALDAPTEYRLLSRLEEYTAGRMVIVVSHRLSAALWASRVVVMHRGEIIETGTHVSLYRPGTHYYALWQRADAHDDAPKELPSDSVPSTASIETEDEHAASVD
jgi:ABC-type multidrug transport system fused ATPase/permease subunit